ncbi:MAG: hypothetical protein HY237_13770 [Acidobacteria bacterium]|nr:hypothetical protein [Acidobacteriota bacterium]
MDANKENRIDERRAAILLGLSTGELRRLSRLSGLGRMERSERDGQMVYTYEELRRLCLLAAPSVD